MARFKKIIFKVAYLSFALVFIIYSSKKWCDNFVIFIQYSKEMFYNLKLKREYNNSVEETIKTLESNSAPSISINNNIPSNERLKYFKENMPIIADYYFGDIRAYEKSIFIKDTEIFGKVISVDWDKQEIHLLVPDVMNIKDPSEEKTVAFICPLSETFVFYGKNVTYDDSLLLENGSLDLNKIVKPDVFVVISFKDSFYDSEADWCTIY